MTRNKLLNENPRFDIQTGRPFVLNCLENIMVVSREYLDSKEVVADIGMSGLTRLVENSRIGTPAELNNYLKSRGLL